MCPWLGAAGVPPAGVPWNSMQGWQRQGRQDALGSGGTGESVRPVCHKEGPLWGLAPTTTSLSGWTLLLTLQHRHLHEGLVTEMALRVMAFSCDTKHGIPEGGPHTETWHKHTAPGYSLALPCPPLYPPLYPHRLRLARCTASPSIDSTDCLSHVGPALCRAVAETILLRILGILPWTFK